MINDQLVSQISLLVKSVAPPLIHVTDSPIAAGEEPHWSPGDRLPATVLTNLPNGRFQVQVDNHTLEMNLPKNTQPGEQMELVYVSNSPRLTFTLAATSLASPQAPAANPPPSTAAMAPGASAPAELSETAHMLGQLSQQAHGATQGVMAQAPVIQSPPLDPRQLAAALQKTINDSGLFYESHQVQWVQGERPLEMLLQEPQAQQAQGQPSLAQPTQGQVQTPQMQPAQGPLSQAPLSLTPAAEIPGTPAHALSASPALSPGQALLANMDPKIAPLLQQQLQLLNTGTIQWSGQAWLGQQMHWEISGMPAGQSQNEQQWQTRLNLVLPNLGAVSAWLLIGPQGLQVRLEADATQTRQVLTAGTGALDRALQAAGLKLNLLTVAQNG